MSADENKMLIRRYYEEVLNQGNLAALEEIASAAYVEHDPLPGQGSGLAGLRQRVEALRSAFHPHFILDDLVAERDTVVVRWTHTGTHVGPFMGMAPTGTSFRMTGIDIHRVQDGKMIEHWHEIDQLGLLQQLGFLPQPAKTGA